MPARIVRIVFDDVPIEKDGPDLLGRDHPVRA
jgi:hypothetical protein